MADELASEIDAEPPVFRCAGRGFEALADETLLGSFDGRDQRELHAHQISDRRLQLLVSMHERLHHELQWSSIWGVTAAMSGLLADAGIDPERLRRVASYANSSARLVHETFATTIGVGVLGVPEGRMLLGGNRTYVDFLDAGLRLGGAAETWPWQFRESAIQMLLRSLMQPAALLDLVDVGFGTVRLRDIAGTEYQPDAALRAVAEHAGGWWATCFADVLDAYPDRGGDEGDAWARVLPEDPERMEALKAWEEMVLIPALQEVATSQLSALGFRVLSQVEYLQAVEALRESFTQHAPDSWNVEILAGRRRMEHEPLGAERETIYLRDRKYRIRLLDPDEFASDANTFLRHEPRPHVLATYALPAVLKRQFAAVDWLPESGPAVLGLVGDLDGDAVSLAVLDRSVSPLGLTRMFSSLPTTVVTTLTTTREGEYQEKVLELEEVVILVDLPLRLQVETWLQISPCVRFRVVQLGGSVPLEMTVFHLDDLPNCWFLSLRSHEGFAELAQLIDRYPDGLLHDLRIPADVLASVSSAVRWILTTWTTLSEIPDD